MRILLFVVALGIAGCAWSNNHVPTASEIAAQQERERLDREAYQRTVAQETEYDRLCLDPQTTYQVNWCAERRRQQERRWYEQRQQAEWAHQQRMQQQRIEAAEPSRLSRALEGFNERRNREVRCKTSPDYGGGSTTTCD